MLRQQPVDQPPPLPPFQYPGAGSARAPISQREVGMQPFRGIPQFGPTPGAPDGIYQPPFDPAFSGVRDRYQAAMSRPQTDAITKLVEALFGLPGQGPQAPGPRTSLPMPPRPAREGEPRGYFARGGYARGGLPDLMLGMPQRRAEGSYVEPDGQGNGRSDHIPAVLSPGEYVIDAELVSLLGDGDNDAGARALDQFREDVRKHKGGRLARGEISHDAKPAASYLKKGRH